MQPTAAGSWIAWVLAISLAIANIAGYAFDLYRQFWWFDRVLHGGTILAITFWLALFVFGPALPGTRPGIRSILLLASVGIALGALWEVAEWGFESFTSADFIKGKNDTILDIVMDTGGAMLAALLAPFYLRPGTARVATMARPTGSGPTGSSSPGASP